MYNLIITVTVLSALLLAIVYSAIFDDEFQDALDDYRRLIGTWRPANGQDLL